MGLVTKKRVKYVLAAIGAAYLVLFVGYLVYAGVHKEGPQGPSELELHPERAGEIHAQERAERLQERLKLSDEQTQQVAEILEAHQSSGPPAGGPPGGSPEVEEEIAKVLTPEQQALQKEMQSRRPGGGPGGRGGPAGEGPPEGGPGGGGDRPRGGPPGMNSERLDALKEAMTPEQKARFEKQLEKMKSMPFGRGGMGRRGGPGGQGGQGEAGGPGGPGEEPGGSEGPPPAPTP